MTVVTTEVAEARAHVREPSATRVFMLVRNPCTHDARVLKEAAALAAARHEVTVVATRKIGSIAQTEERDGFGIVRCLVSPIRLRNRGAGDGRHRAGRGPWVALAAVAAAGRRLHKPLLLLDYSRRALAIVAAELTRAGVPRSTLVFHANHGNTLVPAYLCARRYGGRFVYDSHEYELEAANRSERGRLARALFKRYEGFFLRRADAAITVSPSVAADLARIYGIPAPIVVRNCAPLAPHPRRPDHLRRALGLASDTPVALYHGNLKPHRGLLHLVAAARHMPEVAVVLVGSGGHRAELEAEADRLDVRERVFFLDPVPLAELVPWVASADVGVNPIQHRNLGHYYSLPNKLFECLMAGVPVAASHFPEIRAVIETEDVGRTFDPESPADIARAIREILGHPEYEAMRQRARAAAEERHSWEAERPRLLGIYEGVRAFDTLHRPPRARARRMRQHRAPAAARGS